MLKIEIEQLLVGIPPDRLRKIVVELASQLAGNRSGEDPKNEIAKSIVIGEMAAVGQENPEDRKAREKEEARQDRADRRAARAAEVLEEIRTGNQPRLRGSAKQIAWAEEIEREERHRDPYNSEFNKADARKASWWIDRHMRKIEGRS